MVTKTTIEIVKFHDDFLEVVKVAASGAVDKVDGKYWVSVKKVCENIDIDFNRQHRKLKSDPTFHSKLVEVQTNGGVQKVFCIPFEKLNGWLFSINQNRVKPEVKQKLIAYKEECFDVLFHHFVEKATQKPALKQPDSYIYQLERENIELKRAMNRLTADATNYEKKLKALEDVKPLIEEH